MINRNVISALIFLISCTVSVHAQHTAFDSFVTKVARQYKVDVALSPELIPTVDSILESGTPIETIDALLHLLVNEEHITYQIVDGNKLMLRREDFHPNQPGIVNIEGTITDQREGQPLSYAIVKTMDGMRGCQTDEKGHFVLSLADTTGMIEVNYLGYAPIQKPISAFLHGPVTIPMRLHEIPLEEVTIVIPYKEFYRDQAAQSLNLTQYELISEDQLLQWNVERMITTQTSYTSFSTEEGIRIRGVDAGNSLFIMDGLPVYNPYHFYNIFSPFHPDYFSSIKLYKNNLPVEYGGRIDGMIQLSSSSRAVKNQLVLDNDFLLSSLAGRLAIGKTFSFSAGARFSHTGILNDALADTMVNIMNFGHFQSENEYTTINTPTFNFYDINAGLRGQPGPGETLDFHFFSSRDKLKIITTSDFTIPFFNQDMVAIRQELISHDQWQNQGFSTGFQKDFADHWQLALNGFYSHYDKNEDYESNLDEDRYSQHHQTDNRGFQKSGLNTLGFKAALKNNITVSSGFEFGLDLNNYKANLEAKENGASYVNESQQEFETTLFGEYHSMLIRHLAISAGARMTHLNKPTQLYLLPNLKANYFLGTHFSFRAAFAQDVQAVHEITVENRFGREMESLVLNSNTTGYPVLSSDKYMIGGGYSSAHFSFDAEFFYKKLDGLMRIAALSKDPGFDDHQPPQTFYRLFTGDGWTRGLDLTAYYKKGRMDMVVAYTLSKIAERYDGFFNGQEFSPQEDRRHQIKGSLKYKMGAVDVSVLATYKSQASYLSYLELEMHDMHGEHGNVEMAEPKAVFKTLPEFISLDLGADYNFNLFKDKAQLGISLINATDHDNIQEIQHTGRVSRDDMQGFYLTQQTELLGRTFNAHFKLIF